MIQGPTSMVLETCICNVLVYGTETYSFVNQVTLTGSRESYLSIVLKLRLLQVFRMTFFLSTNSLAIVEAVVMGDVNGPSRLQVILQLPQTSGSGCCSFLIRRGHSSIPGVLEQHGHPCTDTHNITQPLASNSRGGKHRRTTLTTQWRFHKQLTTIT